MTQPLLDSSGAPFAAACFDVDGTLYRPGARVWWRALSTRGATRTLRLLKRAREGLRDRTFDDGDALRVVLAQEIARLGHLQQQHAAVLITRMRDTYWPLLLAGAAPRATHHALRTLKEAGLRLAAFSDHDTRVKLAALGLETLFDVVVCAEDVGAYKPHVKGFETVCHQLGLPPGTVVHVGDREDTDARGALAAGMGAVLVGEPPSDPRVVHAAGLEPLAARIIATRR
jgi:putative hydrolase of the HAD superfamily